MNAKLEKDSEFTPDWLRHILSAGRYMEIVNYLKSPGGIGMGPEKAEELNRTFDEFLYEVALYDRMFTREDLDLLSFSRGILLVITLEGNQERDIIVRGLLRHHILNERPLIELVKLPFTAVLKSGINDFLQVHTDRAIAFYKEILTRTVAPPLANSLHQKQLLAYNAIPPSKMWLRHSLARLPRLDI